MPCCCPSWDTGLLRRTAGGAAAIRPSGAFNIVASRLSHRRRSSVSRRRPCSYRIGSLSCPPSPICTPRFLCADFPSPCIPQATVSVLDGLGCARSSIRSVTFSDSGMHLTFCLDVVLMVRGIADPGFACFGSHYTRIPFTSPSWASTNVVQSSLHNSSACPWVQDHRSDRSLLRSPVLPNRFTREAWQESFVASPRGRCSCAHVILWVRGFRSSWKTLDLVLA